MKSSGWMKFALPGVVVAGAVAAAAGWLAFRGRPEAAPRDARSLPFWECADEAGLHLMMRFLPNEQGETFRINLYDHGAGLAVGDFDGDGHDDIYFCNQLGPNALYRNKGDGTFEDVSDRAGVKLGDRVCVGATFVDYDNDGLPDLFVTSTRGGNVLFKNQGGGKFRDVTKEAGLSHVGHSQTAVFFDYDNDGFLDLFLAQTAAWTSETYDTGYRHFVGKDFDQLLASPKEPNILYHNNGDGTFTDVSEKSGLKGRGWAGDAVAFDYDGDGRPDLFVGNMFGPCQLYHNNGDATFTEVTRDTLGATPFGAIGAKVFDYNNDGRLDLYVVDMHSDMWMRVDWKHESLPDAQRYEKKKFPSLFGPLAERTPGLREQEKQLARDSGFRLEDVLFGNGCYRNEGGGKFTEVSDQAGLENFWPWGVAPGDFDNDGYEDVFVTAGMGYPFYYWPNYLLMNEGDGTFRNRAEELGVEPPRRGLFQEETIRGTLAARSSRCAVTADFDGDGRLEIVTNNFNDRPYYFKNRFPPKNYVAFRLRGTKSNRDAIGAVVRLYRGGQVLTRQVQGASGYLSQSSLTLHFGLGDRPDIDRVEITWPGGRSQDLGPVAANRLHTIDEPGEGPNPPAPFPKKEGGGVSASR